MLQLILDGFREWIAHWEHNLTNEFLVFKKMAEMGGKRSRMLENTLKTLKHPE